MKKYHYSKGDDQFGPVTIEELKNEKISKDTMVWYEGLENWVKAGEVKELKQLFKLVPPPLNVNKETPPPIKQKSNQSKNKVDNNIKPKKKGLIIGALIAVGLIVVLVISYNQFFDNSDYGSTNSSSSSKSKNKNNFFTQPKEKTEKELKQELAEKECSRPTKYLSKKDESIKGIYKNALSLKFNGFKLKFKIQNSATVVTFKNIKCKVTLTSNSGSTILEKKFTVSEFVKAGSYVSYTGEFACTNQQFKDTDVYSVVILDAECH